MTVRRRIGILGGTFDPIHMGHLITAEMVRVAAALDHILFIPAARPPHKAADQAAPPEERLAMTACAVRENPFFSVSDIELHRAGPSYTVDTVVSLQDALYRWHEPRRLLRSCRLIVATRQGVPLDETLIAEKFTAEERSRIEVLPTPHLEISSTVIRARIRAGLSIRYLVPRAVEIYIEERRLYHAHGKELS